MKVGIASRCRRTLMHMKAFRSAEANNVPSYLKRVQLPQDQVFLGVYENHANLPDEAVIVTDESLWVIGPNNLTETKYRDMCSVDWAPKDKREADSVAIEMRNGEKKFIPIRGKQGGGADLFEFVRFLSRAINEKDGSES